MTVETTNLPSGESDSSRPSMTLDDAANIDFYDPSEDNEEGDQEQQSEIETDEAESQEADEAPSEDDDTAEAEDEGAEDETANPEPEDDVTVTMNGEKVALSELKAGYMKEKDYRNKTMELGNKRRDLDALTARVTGSVNAIADFLYEQIPAMPDFALLHTDPIAYTRQKAMHEAATQQVHAILAKGGEVSDVKKSLTKEQRTELFQSENAALAEAIPATATPEGRKKFFDRAASAAIELGYSDEDIQQVTDHRTFILAHYAALGLQAEKAKAKAQTKVANVPPVTPQRRPQGPNASKVRQNKDAVKRLTRTGSIHDAMAIDFD